MHYVVHVFHQADDDLDDIMSPFYEELEVEPYKEYTSRKSFDSAVKWFAEKKETFESTEKMLEQWHGGEHFFDGELSNVLDEEADTGYYSWTTQNPNSHWDWWVVGGRWKNYFTHEDSEDTGKNTVTVAEALEFMLSFATDEDLTTKFKDIGPYAYLTLEGEWIGRQKYNPNGEGYDEENPNSIFPNNDDYMYVNYLKHVQSIPGLLVTTIDVHS